MNRLPFHLQMRRWNRDNPQEPRMNDYQPIEPDERPSLFPGEHMNERVVSAAEKARRRARIAQVIASFGQPAECGHKRVGRTCPYCPKEA